MGGGRSKLAGVWPPKEVACPTKQLCGRWEVETPATHALKCWARTTVTFPIDDHYNVLAPTLKHYPTIFFTEHERPTKTPGV